MTTREIARSEFRRHLDSAGRYAELRDVAWYGRDDGRAVGAVIEQRAAASFGWTLLWRESEGFLPRTTAAAFRSRDEAAQSLRAAMERLTDFD